MGYDVTDPALADAGRLKIEWAGRSMPVLKLIEARFSEEKPLKSIVIGACLHVTAETANLVLALTAGGAQIALCASNPLSTQDDVVASLVTHYKIPVYARKGEDRKTYYSHLNAVLDTHPGITMDDGADLVTLLHTTRRSQIREIIGSSEETTTGVIRLKAMAREKALRIPVFAVNDSDTKHLFDNRYGTGQSTLDGIMRATNMLLAGKKFVVAGYGWCGRGLAARARGMGSHVIVTEVDPVKALEAVMDGFTVMRMKDAVRTGDIFVTVTGNKDVITVEHIRRMKDGAVIANSGHFNVEIAVEELARIARKTRRIRDAVTEYLMPGGKRIYVLGEGRLINLAAAEGHAPDVMDMSFANQALAAEFFVKNQGRLPVRVITISPRMDRQIARLKLAAMGVRTDRLTRAQHKYLTSWQEGT
ncbi:adenosylhomocysteinase [Candidatus Gottesmanbacteria bacterium RBG_16_52_11]|uniref:Adenosylhomocysteinase n=1 Tax=Candidatus Gottesmanbacteria bacterium RBG_16_52_11 TaxID=1798374 RepID=A0A1F5YP99_9BACT|nr:MAG: adenosylhomocysteinase [Candidatus Gottesmanbacteria bacterium RBG_16_52_11]